MRKNIWVVAVVCAVLRGAHAATPLEPGFTIEQLLSGLGTVTAIAFAPDGTLFVTEKGGSLRVLPRGKGFPQPFATVPVYTVSECGLLGVALDPDYQRFGEGGYVYVFATVSQGEQRIIRFRDENGTGMDRTDIKTGLPTLGANHDGGCLRIAPDSKLYLAIGDGGSGSSKAQDLTTLHGKVMRLNLDGSIPADNPDLSALNPGFRHEIFAYGFRNPFRIALRSVGPGPAEYQVFVNDVGSGGGSRREEVNLVTAGKNYGWPNVEGIPASNDPRYVNPLHAYNAEGNCIVGGAFYVGDLFPSAYRGDYFYMDYGSNKVFRMSLDGDAMASNATFANAEGSLIDIAEGPDGALYYSTGGGGIYRIGYETPGNARPAAKLSASPGGGPAPLTVSFDARESTDSDGSIVRFDWTFGDGASFLDGGPQIPHDYTRNGKFTARVTVRDDHGGASSATFPIDATGSDLPPVPEILAPLETASFDAGDTVQLSGRATDREDGELPGASLTWDVVIVHLEHEHVHPIISGLVGTDPTFVLPVASLSETWNLTIRLTATDSKGHTAMAERLVGLNRASFRLESDPPGLEVKVGGTAYITPAVYDSVNGALLDLTATTPQDMPGTGPGTQPLAFKSWSDGGAQSHKVTAREGLVFTAVFEPDPVARFIRGDSNRDGKLDISDPVFTLNALFTGGAQPTCPDSADANDDGTIDISDSVASLNSLFTGRGPLPEPTSVPGFDPTGDDLRCGI